MSCKDCSTLSPQQEADLSSKLANAMLASCGGTCPKPTSEASSTSHSKNNGTNQKKTGGNTFTKNAGRGQENTRNSNPNPTQANQKRTANRPQDGKRPPATSASTVLTYADIPSVRMIDIGANLLTGCYSGFYRSSEKKHPNDLEEVLIRAINTGVEKIMLTSCSLSDTKKALRLAQKYPGLIYTTIGFHPTHTCEIEAIEAAKGPAGVIALEKEMLALALKGKKDGTIVAIGECGLDFHPQRLRFSNMETQLKYFPMHLRLAKATGLPLFLHNRDSSDDFLRILEEQRDCFTGGVVHSFDGGREVMERFVNFSPNMYIGYNGCSLRGDGMLDCLRATPLDRIMIETDAPYCEIKNTHPGSVFVKTRWPRTKDFKHVPVMEPLVQTGSSHSALFPRVSVATEKSSVLLSPVVDGRLEPCHTIQVLEVIAGALGQDIVTLSEVFFKNTMKVFFKK